MRKSKFKVPNNDKKNGQITLENGVLWVKFLDDRKSKNIFWDPGSFRPDIEENLKDGVEYKTDILLDKENLPDGEVISFIRSITIHFDSGKKKFVNVR